MKRYVDRKRREAVEFKVGDLVLLSTKDLKWQIKGRRLEKLMEWFIGPYKVKSIILANAVELDLLPTVKIYPVVNISRLQMYKLQVEGQKVMVLAPGIVEGEKEYKVVKILNKRKIWRKNRFLVQWKGYMVEADTWERRENLENAKELVEEFEREFEEAAKEVRQQKQVEEEEEFNRALLGKYTAKLMYGWGNRKYKREREKR